MPVTAHGLPCRLAASSGCLRGGIMKRSQWVVIGVLLAAMVFGITFMMNYLGGRPTSQRHGPAGRSLDVTFLSAQEAPSTAFAVEGEERAPNHRDVWFLT